MSMRGPQSEFLLRVAATFATSALVFVLTYLAAWTGQAESVAMGDATSLMLRNHYRQFQIVLEEFADKHGRFPDSLKELATDDFPADPWGLTYQYEKTKDGFRIFSLGKDGKAGGVGLDRDFDLDEQGSTRFEPTFAQFAFQGAGSNSLFLVALASSFCASMTCYLAGGSAKYDFPGVVGMIVGTGIIVVVAVVIATFLVAFYMGALGSGH